MTFPTDLMYKHIKDKKAFDNLDTPFVFRRGYTSYSKSNSNNPIVKSAEKYKISKSHTNADLSGISHTVNKMAYHSTCDLESDDDIYGGWGSMNDYKI